MSGRGQYGVLPSSGGRPRSVRRMIVVVWACTCLAFCGIVLLGALLSAANSGSSAPTPSVAPTPAPPTESPTPAPTPRPETGLCPFFVGVPETQQVIRNDCDQFTDDGMCDELFRCVIPLNQGGDAVGAPEVTFTCSDVSSGRTCSTEGVNTPCRCANGATCAREVAGQVYTLLCDAPTDPPTPAPPPTPPIVVPTPAPSPAPTPEPQIDQFCPLLVGAGDAGSQIISLACADTLGTCSAEGDCEVAGQDAATDTLVTRVCPDSAAEQLCASSAAGTRCPCEGLQLCERELIEFDFVTVAIFCRNDDIGVSGADRVLDVRRDFECLPLANVAADAQTLDRDCASPRAGAPSGTCDAAANTCTERHLAPGAALGDAPVARTCPLHGACGDDDAPACACAHKPTCVHRVVVDERVEFVESFCALRGAP